MNKIKRFLQLSTIGIVNFLVLFTIYQSLTKETVYQKTLGQVSENYIRTDEEHGMVVKKDKVPYKQLSKNNLHVWDADIYRVIAENMYVKDRGGYEQVRGAFFPLFPLLWKFLGGNTYAVVIANYLLFILGIALLLLTLYPTNFSNQLLAFLIAINLPSVVIYLIPYSEALFLITAVVGIYGVINKNYLFYFIGFTLMAMVRPATLFVLLSIISAEVCLFMFHKSWKQLLVQITYRGTPFFIGYACVLLIQFYFAGSWTTYIEAQQHWAGEIQLMKSISDWSVEGFALSIFAIFGICLPAAMVFIYIFFGKGRPSHLFKSRILESTKSYILLISIFYLVGLLIFTLLTSGGNLHSFYRFTLASPFFYCALFLGLDYYPQKKGAKIEWSYLICMLSLGIFLYFTSYGGSRLQFSFMGLYLFILLGLFVLINHQMIRNLRFLIAFILIFCSMIWNTYLFNMFLSDGWVFT